MPDTPMPELGYSPENPIAVGGGRIFAGFNERHYLSRLRGPAGDPVEFERIGSMPASNILDIYVVASAGLDGEVHLLLDAYAPGPNGIPIGFTLESPDEPWALPRSIVSADPSVPAPPTDARPRKWVLAGQDGGALGYAEWSGGTSVALDLGPQTEKLLREMVDHYVGITPLEYLGPVLDDVFERVLPIESGGIVTGVPVTPTDVPEWSRPVWGVDEERRAGRRRRPWSRRSRAEGD